MKILIIGFLVFLGWSSLSTYVYVCKIKGFCHEPVTAVNNVVNPETVIPHDSISKPSVVEQTAIPESLLVYFAFDKSEFSSGVETNRYFEESMKYMFQNTEAKLSITGYTDAVGTDEYNQALGYRRAESVKGFFEEKGMSSTKIVILSKGEKEPAEDNNTISGRAKNRRAVITIKP